MEPGCLGYAIGVRERAMTRSPDGRRPALLAFVVMLLLAALPASAGAQSAYTALGDSYTAGPLIPNQIPDPPGCLRSDRNYPHLVAAEHRLALDDVSCSGAKTDDMFAAQKTDAGTNPPQLDAVHARSSFVTVGIGGNDIGFSSIIDDCTAVTPQGPTQSGYQYCKDYYTRTGVDELAQRIAATQPKVERVLAAIRAKAPTARISLVGYPAVLPPQDLTPTSTVQCWPQLPITYPDIPYLRATQERLNTMLAAAAANQGARYVNTYGGSTGHNACTLPGVRWIEPLTPTSPAAPVHPNAAGEAFMASVVSRAVKR
jgi:lysophospholipase L1-like esterase